MIDIRTWRAALLLGALAVSGLAGCATAPPSFDTLDAELPKYLGRPVSALVHRLGYPDDERRIMGKTTYTWATRRDDVYVSNSPPPFFGYGYGYGYGFGYDTHVQVARLTCRIRIRVDAKGIVTWWDYDGDEAACRKYARRLAPAMARKK